MKLLDKIADAITGNSRQTGEAIVSIAQRGRRGGKDAVTELEFKRLCMSAISQARK